MTTPADAERANLRFEADLTRYTEAFGPQVDRIIQVATQTVFNEVQSGGKYSPGTPVDTGYHRANWAGGIGEAPAAAVLSKPAQTRPGAHAADVAAAQEQLAGVAASARAGDVVVMENNGPAITRLEDGWSGQAPEGMVKLTLLHAQEIVDEAAAYVLGRP